MLFSFLKIDSNHIIYTYKELVMAVCTFLLNFMNKSMHKDLTDRPLLYLIAYTKRKQ